MQINSALHHELTPHPQVTFVLLQLNIEGTRVVTVRKSQPFAAVNLGLADGTL
jgi:hypothetical protein